MGTIIVINIVLATIVLATIVGLIARSIATAPSDRGVTLVRHARLPRLDWTSSRPVQRPVARA
jgi:hypothetical protein